MEQEKLPVPKTICISTNAYERFMNETELRSRVLMEYHRKPFDQMRWEEMWDCSLRIQHFHAIFDLRSLNHKIKGRFFCFCECRSGCLSQYSVPPKKHHEYQLYLGIENIDHSKTKARSPQSNGICGRFHKTVLDEFHRIAFRRKIYNNLDELQDDLDT